MTCKYKTTLSQNTQHDTQTADYILQNSKHTWIKFQGKDASITAILSEKSMWPTKEVGTWRSPFFLLLEILDWHNLLHGAKKKTLMGVTRKREEVLT